VGGGEGGSQCADGVRENARAQHAVASSGCVLRWRLQDESARGKGGETASARTRKKKKKKEGGATGFTCRWIYMPSTKGTQKSGRGFGRTLGSRQGKGARVRMGVARALSLARVLTSLLVG